MMMKKAVLPVGFTRRRYLIKTLNKSLSVEYTCSCAQYTAGNYVRHFCNSTHKNVIIYNAYTCTYPTQVVSEQIAPLAVLESCSRTPGSGWKAKLFLGGSCALAKPYSITFSKKKINGLCNEDGWSINKTLPATTPPSYTLTTYSDNTCANNISQMVYYDASPKSCHCVSGVCTDFSLAPSGGLLLLLLFLLGCCCCCCCCLPITCCGCIAGCFGCACVSKMAKKKKSVTTPSQNPAQMRVTQQMQYVQPQQNMRPQQFVQPQQNMQQQQFVQPQQNYQLYSQQQQQKQY